MIMKILTLTVILSLLSGTRADEKSMNPEGPEGGEVSFRSSHKLAWNYDKYLCKDPCQLEEQTLAVVKPGEKAMAERVSLHDTGDGVFTVTISQLELSDSGTYWCGVDRPLFDTFTKVHLTVIEDLSHEATTNMALETTPLWTLGYERFTNSTEVMYQTDASTHSTQKHDVIQQRNTASIVLYSGVGALASFTALVVVLMSIRKCKAKARPQVQVCSNTMHIMSADQNKASGPHEEENTEHESAPVSSPADPHQSGHVYENVSCIKNVADTTTSATPHHELCHIYINALSTVSAQDSVEKCTESHTSSSDGEAAEQTQLWFGLVFPQAVQPQ